jgi:hypothetical protein
VQVSNNTLVGRLSGGGSDIAALSATSVRGLLNVADGATANSTDATLLNRANHTGTQAISTVTGLQTALDGKLGTSGEAATVATINGRISAGTNVTLSGTGTAASPYVINASGGGGGGGSGDVVGPASATDNAIVRFDGATGKLIQNSSVSITDNGSLVLPENSTPTPADAGTMKLFTHDVAGRLMPAFVGPSGLDSIIQPFFARNNITALTSVGNIASINSIGSASPTVTGFTAAARTTAATNFFTRMRKTGYVTAATAGAVGQFRFTTNTVSVGDGTGLGGFFYCIRFGISDAADVAGARMFMGVGVTATPSNVEPSTLTSCIGIGHGASDTNFKIFYGGSAAQTPIDLGANFPCNTRSTDMYELALFAPPSVANTVRWMVTRLNTGHVESGTISGGATVLPQSSTLMAGLHGYRTNNATPLAVAIDFSRYYLETDF